MPKIPHKMVMYAKYRCLRSCALASRQVNSQARATIGYLVYTNDGLINSKLLLFDLICHRKHVIFSI